jgi:FKBP-type peptidyl-prolyl cis-trans isomerase SlyD
MKVGKDTVVGIEYSLHLGDGKIIDSSEGEPLRYIQGASQIVPGLEKALEGAEPGTEKKVEVSAADGYGDRDETAVRIVPLEAFDGQPIQAGDELVLVHPETQEQVPIKIASINGSEVTVDFNHPLAGRNLHFSVKVVDVRPATKEELEHGHAHGEGGEHD